MGCPEFVVVGHITKDLLPEGGSTVGGTVTYSAVAARNLGYRAGILTSAADDLPLDGLLDDIDLCVIPSPVTSTFENIYLDGSRLQYIRAVARPISREDYPPAWLGARVVHLGPLAQEISPDFLRLFEHSLVGVTPQGWMRRWDAAGRVHPKEWEEAEEVLSRAEVLIFSEEDVERDVAVIRRYAGLARIMVVTQARRGATVYCRGTHPRHFPAFPTVEVDPTGAGDVFAAAFLLRLAETRDPYVSARFANCAASFSVEKKGVLGIATLEQVRDRLRGRL